MNIQPLKIGDLVARLPIIQGGMGVGVSRSNLATAVCNAGGIGVISSAQIGFDEPDFNRSPKTANMRALTRHIKTAKANMKEGILGLNVMVALNFYDETIKTAVEAGIDLIISGAGLPTRLPELVAGSDVKIAPIISSSRACKTLLKVWDRKYQTTADLIVLEGPKAGGHLAFSKDQLYDLGSVNMDQILKDVLKEVKVFESKYNKQIPVVVAGGVYTGEDIAHYLSLGASGVQMGTRFIATYECDAHQNFKDLIVNCTEEDIEIVSSPVGMPGRAIGNPMIQTIKKENIRVKKCHNCMNFELCDRVTIPFCISTKLIEAVKGDTDNGLFFCSANAYRVKEIVSVQELMDELEAGILNVLNEDNKLLYA